MSDHRPRQIDRDTAEHLLAGAVVGRHAGVDPLGDLLAAAASPPRGGEYPGEQAVMAAFRAADLGATPEPRRASMIRTLVSKVLTLKAAALLAGLAGGGIALAGVASVLPTPSHNPPAVTASPAPGPGETSGTGKTGDTDKSRGGDKSSTGDKTQGSDKTKDPYDSPSVVGLCHAYRAKDGSKRGKELDKPAFRELVTAAGGKDKVEAFCAAVLASASAKPGDGQQGQNGGPAPDTKSGKPTVSPSR